MSLVPYRDNSSSIIEWGFDLVNTLLYHAYYIYYWLRDFAPIAIMYKLKQMGRNGIDNLPLLSWETKEEIKQWLINYSVL